jgi:hypothetical protein
MVFFMNTLILDAVTKSITAVLAANPGTQPDFTAAYADATATAFTEGSNDGVLNGTSPVTIVAAPAASTRRVIKSITIMNRDTTPVVVTINLVSAGGTRQIAKVTLAVGDTFTLDGTYDNTGALKTKVAGMDVLLSGTEYYGVTWNESTDVYTRTGTLAGVAVGSSPGNYLLPIQRLMRRCVVNDAGIRQYYLSPTDSTKREDGSSANLTGTDGQVMVEIPAFYERYSYAANTHCPDISLYPLTGFSLHPAFMKNGVQVPYRYCGAYEGVLYDTSGAAYTDGGAGQTKDFTATTGDKLSSVSGKLSVTNGTRANFRAIAANRGVGWRQLDFYLMSAIQLLYLVEYASFNSQTMIGVGISNVADWAAYNNYYPIAPSGNSNAIGNASGNTAGATACATEATKYLSYRGIENWFGHVWKWVDGFNINNNIPYVSNTDTQFADNTVSNYTPLGVTLGNANGWQATLAQIAAGFLPLTVGASSSTKITDYYYRDAGWRVMLFGGTAADGASDGGFSYYLAYASGGADSNIGGRLCF